MQQDFKNAVQNNKRKQSKLLDVVTTMPPLKHSIPGEEFDIKKKARWFSGL